MTTTAKRYFRNLLLAVTLLPVVSGLWIVTNAQANALNPESAFSSLMAGVQVNQQNPGYFDSGIRKEFVAGGVAISIPRSQMQLISVTPASVSGGSCSGISMVFGGISFVNSDQLVQAMKAIAQNAVSSSFMVALKTLCPICGAVLEFIKKLSQAAAAMTLDSCRVSQRIAGELEKTIKANVDSTAGKAARPYKCLQTTGPIDSDAFTTLEETCNDLGRATDFINRFINGGGTAEDKAARAVTMNRGNVTFNAARAMGFKAEDGSAEFLVNLLGTVIARTDVPATTGSNTPNPEAAAVPYKPMLKPKDAIDFFMCGTSSAALNNEQLPVTRKYCGKLMATAGGSFTGKYYKCMDGNCETMRVVDVASLAGAEVFSGKGFLPQVEATLAQAVQDVSNAVPLKDDAIHLIQIAPFPLYEALNIAAVYRTVAHQVIAASAVPISAMLSQSMFDRIITDAANAGPGARELPPDVMHQVVSMLAEMEIRVGNVTAEFNSIATMQTAFMQQIRQLEARMQAQAMHKGLAGNQAFADGVLTRSAPAAAPN